MRKPHHQQGAHLNAQVVSLTHGLRKRLAHVVALAHGHAVVVVDKLNPDCNTKAAGGRHRLHERAVTELFQREIMVTKRRFFPAQQCEHLGVLKSIRQEIVVREL